MSDNRSAFASETSASARPTPSRYAQRSGRLASASSISSASGPGAGAVSRIVPRIWSEAAAARAKVQGQPERPPRPLGGRLGVVEADLGGPELDRQPVHLVAARQPTSLQPPVRL